MLLLSNLTRHDQLRTTERKVKEEEKEDGATEAGSRGSLAGVILTILAKTPQRERQREKGKKEQKKERGLHSNPGLHTKKTTREVMLSLKTRTSTLSTVL